MSPLEQASVGIPERPAAPGSAAAETARLAAVARYNILDTPPDGAFDRIAALAARWLDTPIGTVSIVDADRIWFKAVHGLDGVAQVGRDPGLCASAIGQCEPYLVAEAHLDERTRDNALVHGEMGVRFYAAAPIITADGFRLGTVNVLDSRPRQVTDTDLAILADLAALVMDQLELRLSALTIVRREREMRERAEQSEATITAFATTLQRTLLPPALPRVPGLELACHYHAASVRDVGGDFYDVFALGDGRWAFFLGDVSGHGADAAAVTSLVRYTLRAAALHSPDPNPVTVLTELNAAMLRGATQEQRFCTAVFGLLEPEPDEVGQGFRITVATGGHPAAFWLRSARAGEPAGPQQVGPDNGMLLGVVADPVLAACSFRLAVGDALLFFTDGLTEARPGGEFFDEAGLAAFLAGRVGHGAARLVDELAALVAGFAPAPTDDIALLALSVPSETESPPSTAGGR